jgi:hypothetical protein
MLLTNKCYFYYGFLFSLFFMIGVCIFFVCVLLEVDYVVED